MGVMVRSSSGLLGVDTFGRSAGTVVGNGWVEESGDWTLSGSTLLCNTGGANYGKIRWNTISAAGMVVEITARQTVVATGFIGPRAMARSGDTSYDMYHGASSPKSHFQLFTAGVLNEYATTSLHTPANNTYYRIRHEFQPDNRGGGSGNRRVQGWVDTTIVLGPDFQVSVGHTGGTDNPGIAVYNTAAGEISKCLAYKRSDIIVNGLTGSQGARLHASDGSVLGSSGTQSGGVAYIPVTLLAMPITGYVQTYDDAGTWLAPIASGLGGRYPDAGSASDIYGGDAYEPPSLVANLVQADWLNLLAQDAWPVWDQTNADISARVKEIHIERGLANPRVNVDTCEIVLDDYDNRFVPTFAAGPIYPNVTVDRGVRVLLTQGGDVNPGFFGPITAIVPGMDDKPTYRTTIRLESPLRKLASVKIHLPPISAGYAYNSDTDETLQRSALKIIVDLAGQVEDGYAVAEVNREFTTSDDAITDWGGEEMTVGAALEDLACRVGAMYWVEPKWRVTSDGADWTLVWVPAGWKVGEAPDFTWDTEDGDCDGLVPTFTLGLDK